MTEAYRSHKTLLLAGFVLTMLALAGCAPIRPEPPRVQLTALQVTNLSLSHATMVAEIDLLNPNQFTLDVQKVAFTLSLEGIKVADGISLKPFSLPANEHGTASVELLSSFFNLIRLTGPLQEKQELAFQLEGTIKIGGAGFLSTTIPINREGTISLAGKPLAPTGTPPTTSN